MPNKQGDAKQLLLFPHFLTFVFYFLLSPGDIDNAWKTALLLLLTNIVPTVEKQYISTITFFHVAQTIAFEDLNKYKTFPPEAEFVPNTIMLNLNDVSK